MLRKHLFVFLAAIALTGAAARPSLAASGHSRFLMAGLSDSGDTVELHFDAPPSSNGKLVILGNRSGVTPKSVPFSYRMRPPVPRGLADPSVEITFADKQTLAISCDPLSNNCRSAGYVVEGNATFSLLWHIDRNPSSAR
jgi:hypothetical protein